MGKILSLLVVLPSLTLAESPAIDQFKDILVSQCGGNAGAVQNISFKGSKVARLGPDFGPKDGPRTFPASMRFIAEGKKFFFDVDLTSIDGSTNQSSVVAYDGELFQQYIKNSQRLEISKTARSTSGILAYNNLLFLPYLFLLPGFKEDSAHIIRLEDWTSPDAWKTLSDGIQDWKETSFGGQPCVEFTVPGGPAPLSRGNTTFRVTLAKGLNYFPIKWERLDEKGNTILSYEVLEVGRVKAPVPTGVVYYPRKASSVAYEEANPKRILTTMEGKVEHLSVNAPIEPDVFTLDPASAQIVYDVDHHTITTIPR